MSPPHLRRYRAERLLRRDFDGLRDTVLASVRSKLRAAGASLDEADLEAAYSAAWQGLYTTLLEGEEVENPAGWLVVVTFRRAIDEHRRRREADTAQLHLEGHEPAPGTGREPDFASAIDDLQRLRQLMEGMRAGLSERERQAAALCYLQGLSRSEAAEQMGIGERSVKRLMEGRGRGDPGVAAKLGALAETIESGRYCEQQASLMRAFAFGILERGGERHRLASTHWRSCPACRAYVRSLRGLAAILPPVFLPVPLAKLGLGTGAGLLAGGSGRSPARTLSRLRSAAARASAAAKGAQAGPSMAGLLSAKAGAVGLIAVCAGAGAGVLALASAQAPPSSAHAAGATAGRAQLRSSSVRGGSGTRARRGAGTHRAGSATAGLDGAAQRTFSPPGSSALREFGIERHGASSGARRPGAPTAGVGGGRASATGQPASGQPASVQPASAQGAGPSPTSPAATPDAEREGPFTGARAEFGIE